MDEVAVSEWPEPPGSAAWLPAYGFHHDIMDKEDFFSAPGDTGSTHALYLETIVEETSDDLRSERSSAATWLSDSDADSVIHVGGAPGSECDSGSEREFACPAKRRRRERASSPASDDSLSRSSSLAQFESLERSCAATSISPDSLDSGSAPSSPDSGASGRTLRAPAPPARPHPHLSAENLSEDSGYSELRARPPAPPEPEIALGRRAGGGGGSAPCLAARPRSPERARPPPHAAQQRATSVPDDLDLCAEPRARVRRRLQHVSTFRQSFEVCDSFTISVADLTALDYRPAGGVRRPRQPPPPPPPRHPPPPPPAREPSADSDSTTESERAFTREMELTARRMDENVRRALLDGGGNFDRDVSVLTARRLQEASWGAWDDVLDELRRRRPPPSPPASPARSVSPRRARSPSRTPSPVDPIIEPRFSSTPNRTSDARVRSTPELRARTPQRERRETPEELRASLQHVASPPPAAAPPARSVSTGSKGVTFSPVVAEVSWREVSSTPSERSCSESASDDAADAEVVEVGAGEAARRGSSARASALERERGAMQVQDAARAPRSRIAGFLSRFANFRFSARKNEKKTRSAGATARPPEGPGPGAGPGAGAGAGAGPHSVHIPLKGEPGGTAQAERRAVRPAAAAEAVARGAVAHKPPRPARPPPAPGPGVLETDVDTAHTVLHARSLLALGGAEQRSTRPHKSMEFLLDKENARVVQPPENDLQKNSDRVLSEHELRVQRSLQKLNVPEWYKNAPTPREGFLLRKRLSDASSSPASARWTATGLNSKTTSLGSLGGAVPPATPLANHSQLSPATTSFGRWSTSRLNSNQTSPCSSTRSSVRGGTVSPLCSPSARSSFSARQPYLGWRSQERLACSTPRTPHERLASSLLVQSSASKASEEIQSSIKEVTSAIVHYVSGLEPGNGEFDGQASPRGSQKLCWVESSFVGTKPLDSPQTPLVVSSALPPPHPRPPSSLRLELQRSAPPEWQSSQRSLINLVQTKPSPGSTTLEDVLDSLLGLPSAPARVPTPQPSPRKPSSPYYLLNIKSPRYEQLSGHSNSSIASKTFNNQSTPSEDGHLSSFRSTLSHTSDTSDCKDYQMRRKSSADSTYSTLAPGKDTVDNTGTPTVTPERVTAGRRPRSAHSETSRRRSEPFSAQKTHSLDRRTSFDISRHQHQLDLPNSTIKDLGESKTSLQSVASLNTDNSGEESLVKCKYSKCISRATPAEVKRHYKNCHNCNYVYCSKECRRAHWEKHRKVCLHSRASTLCRQILSTAKEDTDSLHQVSMFAHKGYLALGRGVVKIFFTSPEAAEKFTTFGFQYLSQPEYVKWTELQPNEMGAELYTEVVKLCKSYNPETKLILFVAVCIISEVPTKGAVKWERQLVSRCAKLRLGKTVSAASQRIQLHQSTRTSKHKKEHKGKDNGSIFTEAETLVLTSKSICHDRNAATMHKHREICSTNIQKEMENRGVVLKKHFPEIYTRLLAYVDGTADRFIPVTIHPKDNSTGKYFICVIMPDSETADGDQLSGRVTTVDVSVDTSRDQASTPM